jgi:hypothetical protein
LTGEVFGRTLLVYLSEIAITMTTIQEIEKAIEALPLADQVRLYRDLPHLMGRTAEDLDWQQAALKKFFEDESPDDSAYDDL